MTKQIEKFKKLLLNASVNEADLIKASRALTTDQIKTLYRNLKLELKTEKQEIQNLGAALLAENYQKLLDRYYANFKLNKHYHPNNDEYGITKTQLKSFIALGKKYVTFKVNCESIVKNLEIIVHKKNPYQDSRPTIFNEFRNNELAIKSIIGTIIDEPKYQKPKHFNFIRKYF